MSRRGNCHDNAVAESFFSSLKPERSRRRTYKTREEARQDMFDYIEILQPGAQAPRNGMLPPVEFERQQILKAEGVYSQKTDVGIQHSRAVRLPCANRPMFARCLDLPIDPAEIVVCDDATEMTAECEPGYDGEAKVRVTVFWFHLCRILALRSIQCDAGFRHLRLTAAGVPFGMEWRRAP